ncbi:transposase [Methylobacterium sp. 1030]|uniref:transposase n=1 Tax=Methylobacterium sp. 1030 TaxID=3156404 RepID=UPI0033998F2B
MDKINEPGRAEEISLTSSEDRADEHHEVADHGIDDLLDGLLVKRLPILRAQPKTPTALRFAIYARYSSDQQDYDSIKRQVRRCRKYLGDLGVTKMVEFIDEGRTATNAAGREKLQELLGRLDEFDAICFEHFSRWSRETYDAVQICEILEKKGIAVHSALTGQSLDKDALVRGVLDAERDMKARRAWTSGGIDELVYAGGNPRGKSYGFQPTGVPGFPAVDPVQSEAVVLITTLAAASVSDRKIAVRLIEEGYLTPSGTLNWSGSAVRRVRRQIFNTGRVRHRLTYVETNRETLEKKYLRREPEAVVKGRNPKLRLVSDELFFQANNKVRRGSKPLPVGEDRAKLYESTLVALATCDCPGVKDQRYYNGRSRAQPVLSCSLAINKDACVHARHSVDYTHVEREVVRAVRERLQRYDGEAIFAQSYEERLRRAVQSHEARRIRLREELEVAERVADAYMRHVFRNEALSQRAERQMLDQQAAVDALRKQLSGMRDLASALGNMPGRLASLGRALDGLEGRLPFEIRSPADQLFVDAFRKLVPQVRLERHALPYGALRLRIEMHPEAAFFDNPEDVGAPQPEIIVVDTVLQMKRDYSHNRPAQERSEDRARSGMHALTDQQWQLIADLVPPLPATEHGRPPLSERTVVDAIVFRLREGIPLRMPPKVFGDRRMVFNAMQRFIYAGVPEMLLREIGARDPAWAVGLDLDALSRARRTPRLAAGESAHVPPPVVARRLRHEGAVALDGDRWESVKALVPEDLVSPRNAEDCDLTPRQFCEAMLIKVRTGASWAAIAEILGAGSSPEASRALRSVAGRALYTGLWDRIVAVWTDRHPGLLHGADMAPLESLKAAELHRLESMRRNGKAAYAARRRAASDGPSPEVRASEA